MDSAPLLLPEAPLPRMAHEAGLGFDELVEEILAGARLRAHGIKRNRRTLHSDIRWSRPPGGCRTGRALIRRPVGREPDRFRRHLTRSLHQLRVSERRY